MNKVMRNYWLDVALFILLAINIATLGQVRGVASAADLSLGGHIHAVSGIAMGIAGLMHITMHWSWIRAVLSGKAKGKMKLFMDVMVTLALILAAVSGQAALHSFVADRFHTITGAIALVGLSLHAIKHMPWIRVMTKKLFFGREKASL
jgi:hypothetical protein